jgi:hypothetical protein
MPAASTAWNALLLYLPLMHLMLLLLLLFLQQDIDYLIIVSGSSFSVLRADYEPAAAASAAAAAAVSKPEARMPGTARKGLEPRVTQLTAVFDSSTQLDSIASDAGVAAAPNSAAGSADVTVGECPGGASDDAAAAVRRCAFVAVKQVAAVFVYDLSEPAAPLFQSVVLPPKTSTEDEATPFVAQAGLAYAK